jgi:hypothetical protein
MENLIKALQIFLKYANPTFPTHCEHDVLYVNIDYESVSEEDRDILSDLGFYHDEENGNFKSYKFGSA